MYIESNKNTEIIDQFYTISDSINGVPTIEVENIEIRKEHGDKITMSSNRIKDNFVMVIKEEKSHGDIVYTDMSGVHSFIYDMSFSRIYETKTQYFALESILEYVFAGSGYTYKVDPNAAFYSLRFENFGDKDRLSLINQICDRWKIEYHVNGNKVYFSNRIGADKNSQLRYKMNINDTQVNLDISKGATYIRGYFGDKEKGTYKEAEYLHPLASEYGKLHAEPYSNESITQEKTMNEYMKRKIEETWSLSIKIDVADIDGKDGEDVSVGDTVWAIDERHDIKMQTRIIEMTKHYDNNDRLIKTVVTLGNKTFADLIVTQMLDQTDTTEKIVATNERLEQLKAEFDNGFNAIEQKIVTDIAAVEQQAIDEVNALDEKFAVGLQEHKTSLQADINASYDAAVAKAEQKAKILDESISQMVVDNKAATDKVISQLNDSLGDISSLSGTIAEISATADAAKLQANSVAQDYVKQSAVVVQSDGVIIGSKKVSGKEMASAISVTPSNVDIITKVMRITADMRVAGDIKALSISAVDADIARIRTNILTADSVTSTAIKADAALINKLNTNSILTKYLISDTAIINAIKSGSISAVRGDIAWLKSNIITANSISSTSIKSDLALIDKIFSNSANVARLTSKSAFIKQIQAIEVTAYRLEARDKQASVNIENGSITMNRNNGTKMDISIDGIQSFNSGGSLRFSLTPSLVTTSAVGTSISNVYLACQRESEARVIDMDDVGKDGKIGSYRYKPIRALALKFGLGANGYIGIDGNELRIMSDGLLDGGYKNVRADKGYFSTVDANNEIGGAHFYIRPKRDGELRVTHNNGGATSYANLRSNGIYAPTIDYNGHINGGHLYLRPSSGNEVRFTMTGTTNNWANIRFGSWNAMSHEKYKYDIEEWDYKVLDIYKKDLQLHRYKVGHEKHKMIHHGIILREDSNKDQFPVEWRNGDGYEGTEVLWWNAKAVQELAFENDELRDNIKTLENNQIALKNTVSDLENRLKILEEKLNE